MKKFSLFLMATCFAFSVSAAEVNESALKLEKQYLEIADTLASIHVTDGPCGGAVEAYTSDIVETLRKAKSYYSLNFEHNQESGRSFQVTQNIQSAIGSTLALRDITEAIDFNNADSLKKGLAGVTLYGPAPGAYGNTTSVSFKEDGKIVFGWLEHGEEKAEWKEVSGSFEVSVTKDSYHGYRRSVTLTIDGKESEEYILKDSFEYEGTTTWPLWNMIPTDVENANPYFNGFVDTPSECEA